MAAKEASYYFDMLEKGVSYSLRAANTLKEMFESGRMLESKIVAIKKHVRDAGDHMLVLCVHLNNAFITPIDRDDIYSIAKATGDITYSIASIADVLWMTRLSGVTQHMRHMADYVVKDCEKLSELMHEIRCRRKYDRVIDCVAGMKSIEEAGSKCCKEAMRELFREKDAVEIIKKREVYKAFEAALKRFKDAADCVQSVIITKG